MGRLLISSKGGSLRVMFVPRFTSKKSFMGRRENQRQVDAQVHTYISKISGNRKLS